MSATIGEGELIGAANATAGGTATTNSTNQTLHQSNQSTSFSGGNKTVESRLPPTHMIKDSGSGTPIFMNARGSLGGLSRRDSNNQPPNIMITTNTTSQISPTDSPTHTGAAAGNAESTIQSFGFERTIPSELDVGECFELLMNVQNTHHLFHEWSLSDIQILSQLLTVLKFSAGEHVIETGEQSSFVAIILSGGLEVRLAGMENAPIPMSAGGLLGEMSCFEGGTRTAAVSATQDSAIAILTFNELETLKFIVPDIRMKFMLMFALSGLKKLRRVLDKGVINTHAVLAPGTPVAPPSSPPRVGQSLPGSRSESPVLGPVKAPSHEPKISTSSTTSTASSIAPALVAATQGTSTVKRSTTRRATLQTFSSANLFHQPTTTAAAADSKASSITPASPPRRSEVLFRKRGIEHVPISSSESTNNSSDGASTSAADPNAAANKAAKHRLANIQMVVSSQEKSLQLRKNQIENLTQDLTRMSSEKKALQATIAKKESQLDARKQECDQLKNELAMQKQHAEILERTVHVLEKQVSGTIAETSSQHALALSRAESMAHTADLKRIETEKELRATRDALNTLTQEYATFKAKATVDIQALVHESAEELQKIASLESEIQAWKARFNEAQLTVELITSKERLTEQQAEEISVAKQQSHRLFITTSDRLSQVARELHGYKKILRRLLVSVFVRDFHKRQQLKLIAAEMTTIYSLIKSELKKGTTKHEEMVAQTTTSSNLDEHSDDDELLMDTTPPGTSDRPTTRSTQKKKPYQRFTLMESLVKSYDMIMRLKPMAYELCKMKTYWHETSNSFFERTIELKQQTVDLNALLNKERVRLAMARKHADQAQIAHNKQIEAILAANHPHRKRPTYAPSTGQSVRRVHKSPTTTMSSPQSPPTTTSTVTSPAQLQSPSESTSAKSPGNFPTPSPMSPNSRAIASPEISANYFALPSTPNQTSTPNQSQHQPQQPIPPPIELSPTDYLEGPTSSPESHHEEAKEQINISSPPSTSKLIDPIPPTTAPTRVSTTPLSPRQQRTRSTTASTTPNATPKRPVTQTPQTKSGRAGTADNASNGGSSTTRSPHSRSVRLPSIDGSKTSRTPASARSTTQPLTPDQAKTPKQPKGSSSKRFLNSNIQSSPIASSESNEKPAPFTPTAINPHLSNQHTYSQLALHSASPFVSSHVVHGVLSSAQTIYSQSRRQQKRDANRTTAATTSPSRKHLIGGRSSDKKTDKSGVIVSPESGRHPLDLIELSHEEKESATSTSASPASHDQQLTRTPTTVENKALFWTEGNTTDTIPTTSRTVDEPHPTTNDGETRTAEEPQDQAAVATAI